jgi:hypothetical protein
MNRREAGQLLALNARFTARSFTREDALAWHGILRDIDYDAAEAALIAHFRTSDDFLLPATIVGLVKDSPARMAPGILTIQPGARHPGPHRTVPLDGTCMICDAPASEVARDNQAVQPVSTTESPF